MHRDRLAAPEALGEIIALEEPRHGVARSEANHPFGAELVGPLGVEEDLRARRVEDFEHLIAIGLGVGEDRLARERRARLVLPGGIADHAGEVADQELHLMTETLEIAQLVDDDGVPEVQVRGGRVEAQFDAQLPAAGELFPQLLFDDQLFAAPTDGLDGLLGGGHVRFALGGAFARLRRLLKSKGF